MKKRILVTALVIFCVCILTACGCSHEWINATCETPKTCSRCGETEGEVSGHTWQAATCAMPQTCTVCGKTEGEAPGHSWAEATCQAPRTCSVCAATEGDVADHTFTGWVIDGDTMTQTCSVCAASETVPVDHEAVLMDMLTAGRWVCSRVDYSGSRLPSYYIYPDSTPYFEVQEDGAFHVYTVSTEYDGILQYKGYVTPEGGIGRYLFYCEVDGSPRAAFVLFPAPDDDPYLDKEDPYVVISDGFNALYFKAEPDGSDEVRQTLVGSWVSCDEYTNGQTVDTTEYTLTFGNDHSFTLITDTQITGTWALIGSGGYTIQLTAKVDNQFQSFAASLSQSYDGVDCNIHMGNDHFISFKPVSSE